jgi:hypothetical protein
MSVTCSSLNERLRGKNPQYSENTPGKTSSFRIGLSAAVRAERFEYLSERGARRIVIRFESAERRLKLLKFIGVKREDDVDLTFSTR